MSEAQALSTSCHDVGFAEATRVWARVAALSFGGPAGQIAVMHRILVEERRWIGERRFLHALNFCMLLPGPEATQLAIYVGWLMHGIAGGAVAGVLFVLPGLAALMGLSALYALYGHLGPVAALFFGLKAAVLVIVVQAVIRLGTRSLRNPVMIALAVGAFVALFVFHLAFPVAVLGAGVIGAVGAKLGSTAFRQGGGHGKGGADFPDRGAVLGEETPAHARPNARRSLLTGAILIAIWQAPVLLAGLTLGWEGTLAQIGLFFSRMAVVTFGGAYAVLAYVAQAAVGQFHWLAPGEMLDGLGMAETTPGPLIMVTQFVGFMGAFRGATPFAPLTAAVLGGLLTTWVTFVPCFLWIFTGAPYVEALRGARALNAALAAIGAAVVGVILNLALWFALHVLFTRMTPSGIPGVRMEIPDLSSINWPSAALTSLAAVAAFRFRLGMIPLLGACSAIGVIRYVAGGPAAAIH